MLLELFVGLLVLRGDPRGVGVDLDGSLGTSKLLAVLSLLCLVKGEEAVDGFVNVGFALCRKRGYVSGVVSASAKEFLLLFPGG